MAAQPSPKSQPAVRAARNSRRLVNTVAWVFGLTLAGYPIAGLLSAAVGVSSVITSIPFRFAVLAASAFLLVDAAASRARFRPDFGLLLFWGLYLLRLAYDVVVPGLDGASRALLFFLTTSLVPAVALIAAARYYREPQTAALLFLLSALASAMALVMLVFGIGAAALIDTATDRLFYESINPISLGHAGTTAFIAGIVCWKHARSNTRILLAVGMAAGAVTLAISGSRGPAVALVAALAFAAAARGKIVWLLIPAAALGAVIPGLVAGGDVNVLNRFSGISDDESALYRLIIMNDAIGQFVANPVFGSAYAELNSLQYPHNILVEAAMAMGVVGLALLLVILVRVLTRAWHHARAGKLLLPMIFVQYLVGAQLSGSIWGWSALWVTCALLLDGKTSAAPVRFQNVAAS